ncbi:hypothetical protein AYO47_06825 [Planctomyces sp. SCGC AG-212-M04]|nr:hypothetical protein AYO47_06825 [Planctomyces sp. SCGC AG-212-M04]
MFGMMFALARMASAAWVGAAVLFVVVAVTQTKHFSPKEAEGATESTDAAGTLVPPAQLDAQLRKHVVAQMALLRFPFYYWAGGILLSVSWVSAVFLRGTYLKASRWLLVMLFLSGACGLMAYDWHRVYRPLQEMTAKMANDPSAEPDPMFATLHEHSKQVNGAELALTFLASLLLCLPGTRPEPRTMLVKQAQ